VFLIWFQVALNSGFLVIDEVAVLDAVAVHQREAVDVGFLGDGAGRLFRHGSGGRAGWSWVRGAAGDRQRERGGEREEELRFDAFHRADVV
jgi:hypothetical protein